MKSLSLANLMYMRSFADACPDAAIVQQAAGQLPRGHNLVLLVKLKQPEHVPRATSRHCIPPSLAFRHNMMDHVYPA